MAITSIRRDWNGEVDIVRMISSDSLATVAGAGYLTAQADNLASINNGTWTWESNDMVLCSASDGLQLFTLSADLSTLEVYSTAGNGAVTLPVVAGNFAIFDGTLGALEDGGFLPSDASKTRVVMAGSAVVANHIALFQDTTGTIDDTAATALNNGSIQAGASGVAGTFISFPATVTTGSLILAAVSNAGAFNVTISNASHAQASVYSIPDNGTSTANFIISKLTGTQHITVGSLQVDAGNLSAGSSGNAGTLISFPTTAANGSLIISALNAGGAFNTTIRNSVMGQSTVYSMGDIGAATGGLVVSTSVFVMKSVAGAAAAGGAAAQSFTDAFCTAGSNVIGNWNTQANAVSVLKIVPGAGSFVVTSSGDAGVGTFNYIITK